MAVRPVVPLRELARQGPAPSARVAWDGSRRRTDWAAIGRMRNLIEHHYDKVEDRLVFGALAHRIPDLLHRLGVDV